MLNQKKISKFSHCINKQDYDESIHPFIDEVLSGSAFIKKLNSKAIYYEGMYYSVYEIRLNLRDRLIFVPVKDKLTKKSSILVVELVLQHKLKTSKTLHNPKGLKYDLQKKLNKIVETIKSQFDQDCIITSDLNKVKSTYQIAQKYNYCFIVFDDLQNKVVRLSKPAFIIGVPGSGKTVIELEILKNLSNELDPDTSKRIAFVTQLEKLLDTVQVFWKEFLTDGIVQDNVDFLTVEQLAELANNQDSTQFIINSKNKVDFEAFEQWYELHKKGQTKLAGICARILYEEFRLLSAYANGSMELTWEDFEKVGIKHSLLSELKSETWNLYKAYDIHLKAENLWDPSFISFSAKHLYSNIIVDEGMDLSLSEMVGITQLAEDFNVIIAGSPEQGMFDRLEHISLLIHLLKEKFNLTVEMHELQSCYRCPRSVIELVNKVLTLKAKFTEYKSSRLSAKKVLESQISNDVMVDEVYWTENPLDPIFTGMWNSAQVVVITYDFLKQEAEEHYPGALIVDAQGIKGLDFDYVILYDPFNETKFKEINNRLRIDQKREKNQGSEFETILNGFNVAATRAKKKLFIVQKSTHNNQLVLDEIRPLKTTQDTHAIAPMVLPDSTEQEWMKLASELISRKETKNQAKNILRIRLNKTEEESLAFIEDLNVKQNGKEIPTAVQHDIIKIKDDVLELFPSIEEIGIKELYQQHNKQNLTPEFLTEMPWGLFHHKNSKNQPAIDRYLSGLWQNFSDKNLLLMYKKGNLRFVKWLNELYLIDGAQWPRPFLDLVLCDQQKQAILCNFLEKIDSKELILIVNLICKSILSSLSLYANTKLNSLHKEQEAFIKLCANTIIKDKKSPSALLDMTRTMLVDDEIEIYKILLLKYQLDGNSIDSFIIDRKRLYDIADNSQNSLAKTLILYAGSTGNPLNSNIDINIPLPDDLDYQSEVYLPSSPG